MFLSLMIALKYQEDIVSNNIFYAKVSGIRNEELFLMEIEYLELIEYKLYVDRLFFRNLVVNLNALFNFQKL